VNANIFDIYFDTMKSGGKIYDTFIQCTCEKIKKLNPNQIALTSGNE